MIWRTADLSRSGCFAFTITIALASISVLGQPAADLILVNGNIRTLDPKKPRAEAMAVADGKIISVGENKAVRRLAGAQTRLIDVRGKLVLPGFNDSHVHFTAIGNKFSHLDLRRMNSPDEIIAEVARYTRFLPQGRWIIAAGLAASGREISSILPLDLLDKASPDHPVIIFFADSSAIITNTAGLKLARITSKTKDPSDGQILRDATGAPTGVFIGNAGELVRRYVPANHARNWSEIAETASNNAASLGITSVQDVHSDEMTETLRKLDTAGRLKTRVYECIGIDDWQRASVSAVGLVRTGCVKGTTFGIDGEDTELRKKIGPADRAGLQVMIHAIGASSNRNALNAFKQIEEINGQRDRRFRIEHAARADASDRSRFVSLRVIASMQPHLFYSGPEYGEDYRALLDAGIAISLGSDASMTDFDPLYGISAAVNSGSRSLTVEEAVRAYTQIAAFAEFQETVKGTLKGGMAADFVILSEDIFAVEPSRIKAANVLLTVVNGKVVYDNR